MAVASFSLSELAEASGSASGSGRALLDSFDDALADPGAFRLCDVPVPAELVEQMHQVTCQFFELPDDVKNACRYPDDPYVGWAGSRAISEYGSRDHKEMYHIGPRVAPTLSTHDRYGEVATRPTPTLPEARRSCTLWPVAPADFVQVWHEYYRAMQLVAASLGSVLATVLGIERDSWFDAMQGNWADLAANYYPVVEDGGADSPIYNAAHRDLTVFTILHQDESRAGGLAVQAIDGSWHPAEPIPGTYIVNVGELLTYLSGGRFTAPRHEVTVLPTAGRRSGTAPRARISVPFFYRPSDDRVVRSFVDVTAEPIAVGDWVAEKKWRATAAS
ncbi:MAG TPA: 2OG-Fe(II) oxygenase family protein [Acidimicrobiales bacterium]|nr:2OG-Fe(II) oxygenase family protein [Acidimicrobiales bacterium]